MMSHVVTLHVVLEKGFEVTGCRDPKRNIRRLYQEFVNIRVTIEIECLEENPLPEYQNCHEDHSHSSHLSPQV